MTTTVKPERGVYAGSSAPFEPPYAASYQRPVPHEDLSVRELHCECHWCPPGCTCFNFRVPTEVIEQLRAEPDRVFFNCPRGHGITWDQVRGTSKVDDSGYTIDRSHPLWRLGSGEVTAYQAGQQDFFRRMIEYARNHGTHHDLLDVTNDVMIKIEEESRE